MSSLNKAATAVSLLQTNKSTQSTTMREGAIVSYDTDLDSIVLPSGSAASSTMGVALNASFAAGDRINVGLEGIFPVLLAAGVTVANGARLMVNSATGEVTNATSSCDVIGIAQGARTAGAVDELISVLMTPGARQ